MQAEFKVQHTAAKETQGRARTWGVSFLAERVVVRHYVTDLAPGEDLDDNPETHEMSRDEWVKRCADYGLTVEGKPL